MATQEYTNTDTKKYRCSKCYRVSETDRESCSCGQTINFETGEGLEPFVSRISTNGVNRTEYGASLNEKMFCLKCGSRLSYDSVALKEEPCANCGQTYDIFDAHSYVGENPRKMYCQGCWEALDIRAENCSHCSLGFNRRNSWTYYSSQPTWRNAFTIPGHLIWPAIIVLGIRIFGGPLPWPWWATFIGLAVFSGSSVVRVVDSERERKAEKLNSVHRAYVVFLIAMITLVTAYF